ncbi:hypothetical protein [Actinosynnema pretiosum]|uniref:Enoyl-CoA hydratase n=1 Tax=Actinosynnema pretiosum TaxID=42197 RepID=A0A290ZBJ8_9PSEU|nr:hypothetical protein [Actinosynnema pretiosum]ATE56375.1 hypothetical protein CNX65_26445 [Actinosynnema pretiosum]
MVLTLHVLDGVAVVRADRPLECELGPLLEVLPVVASRGAGVLHGCFLPASGPREVALAPRRQVAAQRALLVRVCASLTASGIPLIAAVDGHAGGSGWELASACGSRVLAEEAVVVGLTGGRVLHGRALDARAALRTGLVDRVAPAWRVVLDAIELAAERRRLPTPSRACRTTA